MTIFAPYSYNWSLGNSVYQIDGLMSAQKKLNHNTFTSAFVTAGADGKVHSNVTSSLPDLKSFVQNGGTLILSFGGASGPFLENVMTEDAQFIATDDLLQQTGCRMIDYDVEGAEIAMPGSIAQRNRVILRLQQKYSNLYVSFTLPVEGPSSWGAGGLDANGVNFMKTAVNSGVKVNVVNCMLMDARVSVPVSDAYIKTMESVHSQLTLLYPNKTSEQIYAMLGWTPMIGKNDDSTVTTVDDTLKMAVYCANKKCGLFSFWAMQRDQVGNGDLAVYSETNSSNFDFFNAVKKGLGNLTPPTPTPPTPTPPTPTPMPPTPTPSSQIVFSDSVLYQNQMYDCVVYMDGNMTLTLKNVPVTPVVPVVPVPTPVVPVVPVPAPVVSGNKVWTVGATYTTGDIVSYNGKNYKCLQPHTVVSADWTPVNVQSLWIPL